MIKRIKNINWKKKIQPIIWCLLLVIIVLHILGMISFYEFLSWYDIILHGLGGLWIGLLVGSLKNISRQTGISLKEGFLIIAAVFAVGILWEFLEMIFDASLGKRWGADPLVISFRDSVGDLIMDLAGAGVSIAVFRFFRKGG